MALSSRNLGPQQRSQVITLAAPVVPLDAVYALWQRHALLLWHPPQGMQAVAVGIALRQDVSAPRRVRALRDAAEQLRRNLRSEDHADAPSPRLWGGFAFAPGSAHFPPWQGFGDASFVIPRLTYWTDGARAWLQGIRVGTDITLDADIAAAHAAICRVAVTGEEPCSESHTVPRQACSIAPPVEAKWKQQIDTILEAIETGEVRKVVAARCAEVTFEQQLSVSRILRNLRHETGTAWRYAMRREGGTLLGATPELLVSRRGDDVLAEALAGTMSVQNGTGEDLLASAKDRSEHQFVCDAIVEALAPLCAELHHSRTPTVRTLRRLFHLATSVRGRLAQPTHVLDLCERLHPTPATCGTPRDRALDMVLSTESAARGWYAAPVGWFDAKGDGEFVVALRSGLVCEDRAYLYAGAGIVAGSTAERELAETDLKLGVLLHALGASES